MIFLLIISSFILSFLLTSKIKMINHYNLSYKRFLLSISISPFILSFISLFTFYLVPSIFFENIPLFILLFILFFIFLLKKRFNFFLNKISFKSNEKNINYLLLFLVFLLISILSINSFFLPISQNDTLEYLSLSKAIYENKNISIYPLLDPNISNGFLAPWTHPPLYFSQIVLSFIIQGDASNYIFFRIFVMLFALSSITSVFLISYNIRDSINQGLFSILLLLQAPLLFLGISSGLIDIIVVSSTCLVYIFLFQVKNLNTYDYILAGLFFGASCLSHSQSLLYLFIFLPPYIYVNKFIPLYNKNFYYLLLSLFFVISYPYFFINYSVYGNIISDSPEVFKISKLNWNYYFEISRGISIIISKIKYGLFKGWTSIDAYGITFFIFSLFFLFNRKEINNFKNFSSPILFNNSILLIVLIYFSGVILSIIIGLNIFIKNERYFLLIYPLISIIASNFYFKLYKK